jgi:hypothetical protein
MSKIEMYVFRAPCNGTIFVPSFMKIAQQIPASNVNSALQARTLMQHGDGKARLKFERMEK